MIALVTPCYNEELTIEIFLRKLDDTLGSLNDNFNVVVVNDCSQDSTSDIVSNFKFQSSNITLNLLNLKFNVGHQGAIFQGMLYLKDSEIEHCIIMDSDGEDDPEAIPELISKKENQIVVVKRGKRSEGLVFKFSYMLYRFIFKLVTSQSLNYGNYCMIDKKVLERINYTSFIHLPAYLLKQKATKAFITRHRSSRIDGKSKLGFKGLLMHAFKSMIEFGEDLLLLFLRMFVFIMIIFTVVLGNIIYQKFFSNTAILGWFSTLAMSLLILAVVCIGFFIIGILLLNLLHHQDNRSSMKIYSEEKSVSSINK